jgi:hypothetical protein
MEAGALHRPILKKAWQITRQFKTLWFLGLFAAIVSGSGEFGLLTRIFFFQGQNDGVFSKTYDNFQLGLQDSIEAGSNLWSNIWISVTESPESFISALFILIVSIAITIFVIWLVTVAQAGLISNISRINKNKKTTINEGIDVGVEKFWSILTVNVIYKVVLGIIFILLGKELLLLTTIGLGSTIMHVALLTIASVIVVVLSFVVRYQILNIVLNKEKVIPAFRSAWQLFTKNWLISLEMAFIVFLVYLVATALAVFLTAIFLAIPLVFIAYPDIIPYFAMIIISILSLISMFVITFFIVAFVSTLNWSIWTLLYDKIKTKGPMSAIMRLSDRSPNLPSPFGRK